jgi:hypothetical protein
MNVGLHSLAHGAYQANLLSTASTSQKYSCAQTISVEGGFRLTKEALKASNYRPANCGGLQRGNNYHLCLFVSLVQTRDDVDVGGLENGEAHVLSARLLVATGWTRF